MKSILKKDFTCGLKCLALTIVFISIITLPLTGCSTKSATNKEPIITNSNNSTSSTPANNTTNSTSVSSTPNATPNLDINDEEIVTLLTNGNDSVRKLQKLFDTSKILEATEEGKPFGSYAPLKGSTFKDMDALQSYLSKELGLNKYFSIDFNKKFVNYLSKNINNEYYVAVGDFGPGLNVKESKIISKTPDKTKLVVTFSSPSFFEDSSRVTREATIIHDGEKWVIDKMDTWGMPTLGK
ncbi:hypothetical protein J2Z44_002147 [Clostridium punense]|uniref:Lipoprotein n=1 Tax=Clostridium punense TaxID=1054297 RepID=A0ABS4K4Y9_9CLOT|nr:DL-endopeptidase inhibitor IseA family protein [Clostridium punense]MBP2022326.1 hypothetical protein [Clostridium punense]